VGQHDHAHHAPEGQQAQVDGVGVAHRSTILRMARP
jgi:hypothetical protein